MIRFRFSLMRVRTGSALSRKKRVITAAKVGSRQTSSSPWSLANSKRKEPLLPKDREKWFLHPQELTSPAKDFGVGKKPSGPFSTTRAEMRDSHLAYMIISLPNPHNKNQDKKK